MNGCLFYLLVRKTNKQPFLWFKERKQMSEEKEKTLTCEECNKTMSERNFYKRKGVHITKMCKKCAANRIQVRNQSTVIPIMEMIDVPFVPRLWNEYIEKFEFDANGERKANANQTILGRYLQGMNLNQYATMDFSDSKKYLEEYENEQEKSIDELTTKVKSFILQGFTEEEAINMLYNEQNATTDVDETLLDKKQRIRLKKKWGATHSDENLVSLETFYEEMIATYDIMTPTHEDQLKQIAKLTVQMNNLLDIGDLKGYSQVSMAYDRIMKASKFSAASQDKQEDEISSIGEAVKMCEKIAFIPQYHTDEPQDIVDVTLNDMNLYTKNLIMGELNLETLISEAANAIAEEQRQDREEEEGEDIVDDFFEQEEAINGKKTTEEDLLAELAEEGYDE